MADLPYISLKSGVFAKKLVGQCYFYDCPYRLFAYIFVILNLKNNDLIMDKDINRIKAVLADKKKSNKWLCEQLGVAPTTVSKWCTNSCQPPMETFMKIAKLLEVDVNDLIRFEEFSLEQEK